MTLSQRELVGFAVQPSAVGTAADPTVMLPVTSFGSQEIFEQIRDEGRRGPNVADFGAYQGVGRAEITVEGPAYIATDLNERMMLGYLIHNILACNTYTPVQIGVTGTWKHGLRLGTTKRYLTVEHTTLRNASDRRFIGCRVTELSITFNAGEGSVNWRANLVGRSPTSVTSQALTDKTGGLFKGWEALIQFNGSPVLATPKLGDLLPSNSFARLISAEWTFRRSPSPFYSATGIQNFADLYLGPLEVTCSVVMDYSAVTDLTVFRGKAQGSFITSFRQGTVDAASNRELAIGSVVMDWGDGPAVLDDSGENVTLQLVGRGLYSTAVSQIDNVAQNGPVHVEIRQLATTEYPIA